MENILPAITLYQPWATWIMRGWKTIETRTHPRFACLENKSVLIHAGQKTDGSDYAIKNPFLTSEQILYNPDEMINGFILGSVFVDGFGKLNKQHSRASLIECELIERWGLFLKDAYNFGDSAIPCKGEMGIWYYDIVKKEKVRSAAIKSEPTLF